MRIIITGCGKVGYTLVEQLSQENHELVVIDEDPSTIDMVKEELDVIGIVGNGISCQTLKEAGVAQADLLIAVTGSDEQNLLCCLIAKKTGNCQTIARVRNPVYIDEIEFLKKEFELAMIINPEFEAANEISRIFQFPSAIKIDTFANGHVELLHFKITEDSLLKGKKVTDVRNNISANVLVSAITRGDHLYIPNGDFVFEVNDRVSIVGKRQDAADFFKKLGLMKGRVHSVLIAGGGKISFYLAQSLIRAGIQVTIVEIDNARCEELTELLPQATIICGDATDQRILEEEGLHETEGFVALTGLDEENILISLFAKGISDAKIITKINRINFSEVINQLNLDCIINPRIIMADYIIRQVRSFKNSENSNVEKLYKMENSKAEALEFIIKEDSKVTNVPLQDLKIRKNILICSIYRNGNTIIPTGQDMIMVGDSVVVILADYRISDIKQILED
jgi:trk system potassium uptake protein TrkA